MTALLVLLLGLLSPGQVSAHDPETGAETYSVYATSGTNPYDGRTGWRVAAGPHNAPAQFVRVEGRGYPDGREHVEVVAFSTQPFVTVDKTSAGYVVRAKAAPRAVVTVPAP